MTNNWWDSRDFPFIRIPKELLLNYKLSPAAVLLYGLMLDRMQLSSANGWKDADGQVYIPRRQAAKGGIVLASNES